MEDCIFCRIIKGEIPCSKVYENEHVLAFLDLNPAAPGHTLVVPKKHAATLLELEPGTGDALLQAMRRIGHAQLQVAGAEGFNCLQNNFPASGQEVMHLHWHVIPRRAGDRLIDPWKQTKYASMDQMNAMAEKLGSTIGR
ncbi:MAG: HIT family protein [Deltaproteobacteria bacterium]|jgi:histidine triad (HIT) family protein|nr:HIT family protein [Deltaproteobacteria bacterium]